MSTLELELPRQVAAIESFEGRELLHALIIGCLDTTPFFKATDCCFVIHPLLAKGDMDAARHAGTKDAPQVKIRTVVRELKARCRFFDGYDWPNDVKKRRETPMRKYAFFIIDDTLDNSDDQQAYDEEQGRSSDPIQSSLGRKKKLMGELLGGGGPGITSTFRDVPLPEERGAMFMDKAEHRRHARRINCFLSLVIWAPTSYGLLRGFSCTSTCFLHGSKRGRSIHREKY